MITKSTIQISNLILLFVIGLGLSFCTPYNINPEQEYKAFGWFPDSPGNIADLNTVYDDYNSNIHVTGKRIDLYYSTNKETQGDNFDISSRCIDAFLNLDSNVFDFRVSNAEANFAYTLLPIINTKFDEYGPFSFYSDSLTNSCTCWYFMYANNKNGNFDIHFTYTSLRDWGHWDSKRQFFGPFDATILNSESDDFYPTINADYFKLYFSSNRGQNYDIYEIDMDFVNIIDWLQNGTNTPVKNNILSSSFDDKCPYIKGNLMVFTSNNTAGYGGYDLWYSKFENGDWGAPQNFGPQINTEYDEYRPVIDYFPESTNDLMIFSSNRPGGKGGFDLYYTGIEKMIKK